MSIKSKTEYGDFQTPQDLAIQITSFIKEVFPNPSVIIEPTCGLGNFIKSALLIFHNADKYYAFDVNNEYLNYLRQAVIENNCFIKEENFFEKDWEQFFNNLHREKILVIGNPPWVTNSTLAVLNSQNIPHKSNFQNQSGLAAKTGKANFDIAEWILIKIIENLHNKDACLAMLCKIATARKVLKYSWNNNLKIYNSSLHIIDAKKYFGVSVDACLFVTHFRKQVSLKYADVYNDLSFKHKVSRFGIYKNQLIANIDEYKKYQHLDGREYYKWRSGVKHDAAKVMELSLRQDSLINGFGKKVKIEEDYIYPLLKSSDLGNSRITPRKYVILTQKQISDDTFFLKDKSPKLWAYLEEYAAILDKRKSIIYKKRPRFSIFGIGNYSFAPWLAILFRVNPKKKQYFGLICLILKFANIFYNH